MYESAEYNDHNLESAIQLTKRWYGRILPTSIVSNSFTHFASNSKQFAEMIAKKAKMFIAPNAETAYTDGKDIYMAGIFMLGEFYRDLGIADQDLTAASIACVNGVQAHEALHIRLSDKSKIESINRIPDTVLTQAQKKSHAFSAIINCVEDVFIEHYGIINYPVAGKFIQCALDIMFSQYVRDQHWKKFEVSKNSADFINVLVLGKNSHIAQDSRYDVFNPILDILNEARNEHLTRDQRAMIAAKLYLALNGAKNPISGDDMQNMVEGDNNAAQSYDAGDNADGQVVREMLGALVKSLIQNSGVPNNEAGMRQEAEKQGDSKDEIAKQVIFRAQAEKSIAAAQEAFEITAYEQADDKSEKLNKVVNFESSEDLVKSAGSYSGLLRGRTIIERELPEWKGFDKFLREAREVKHTTGMLRDNGTRIQARQIHRIVTDSKFLTNVDATSLKRGKPEIIFLLDMSGSMGAYAEGVKSMSGRDVTLSDHVTRVGYSAYMSLLRAGIACAVYAHSTDSDDNTHVVGIAANNMPLMGKTIANSSQVRRKFDALYDMMNNSNRDGVAVEFVADRFTSRAGTKMLFVLSDGQPSAGGYGGKFGINHTSGVVRDLRKRGVNVMAISLVKSVVQANNEIYGKDYNIHAYEGRLSRSLQDAITKLGLH